MSRAQAERTGSSRESALHTLPGDGAVSQLLAPYSVTRFFEQFWERSPLVVNRPPTAWLTSILSLEEIDRILASDLARFPDVVLVNAAGEVARHVYVRDEGYIDHDRLLAQFAAGATVILNRLQRHHPPLQRFCAALEQALAFPCQANVYLTPSGGRQGFKPHFDTHDVFVLQIAGTKRWRLYESNRMLPLPGERFNKVHVGKVVREFEMRPGNVAYLPRGLVHDAVSLDDISLHITIGVHTVTWAEVMLESVARLCTQDERLRASIPVGTLRADENTFTLAESFRKLAQYAASRLTVDELVQERREDFVARRRTLLAGQIGELARLSNISPSTVVRPREGLMFLCRVENDELRIIAEGKRIRLPVRLEPAVRHALTEPASSVAALPGDLHTSEKIVLVRRLIREGLLQATGD